MNLSLKKFDMASIKDDSVVVLVGKRNTGKSVLVKDLLSYKTDMPVGTVISPTEMANCFYGSMIPPLFIHGEYSDEIVQKILLRQMKVINKIKSDEQRGGGKSRIDPRAFLILDDCLYDSSWTKSKYVRSLFMNGRHYKMMFLITMQFALGIPPNLRTNIDYVFILRENIISNRKRLYDSYAGVFPSFEIFCSVMDQCTENFECLVICNNAKSNKLEDQVFWYKADMKPDFKIGAKALWDYSRLHCKNNEEEGAEFDPTQINGRKNKTLINVKKF